MAADDRRPPVLLSFAEHRDALMRFLTRRLNNTALAEDLTQETWLRAATAQGTTTIDNPRGYLFQIASRLALDHLRHVGHKVELPGGDEAAAAVPDPEPSPEKIALYRSELARLRRVVYDLPPRCREVFLLAKFAGLGHAEIAARLGISRHTVVSHMVNALATIERAMDSEP
jgi:RNA polymerase sigma-70 factor (ECF subfamily)